MQEFNYRVEHRSSTRMQHVDSLSRCTNILFIVDDSFEFALAAAQKKDIQIQKISAELEKNESKMFALINGLVYRKSKDEVMFYVPKCLENQVIQIHHDALCHLGTDKCHQYLKKTYWFPEMKSKIKEYIKNCLKCIHFSMPSGRVEGSLNGIPKGQVPFEVVHVDHLGPLPCSSSKKHILVFVDGFTKFIKLYAVKSTQTIETIKCLESYFNTYSRPSRLISDRGSCFTSRDFEEFVQCHNIQHIKVATLSPQSNGQVERINRVIVPMLSKLCDSDTSSNWSKFLAKVEFSVNNTVNRSTGQTPSMLLFGVRQKGEFCDRVKEMLENNNCVENVRNVAKIRQEASNTIKENQRYNKEYFDKRHKIPYKYKIGDYVMIKNVISTPGVNKKLHSKFRGPYEVSKILQNDRYIIQDIDGMQVSRVPYKGVSSPANMKPYIEFDGNI